MARGRRPKRPSDGDLLLIESDAPRDSGIKRPLPEEMPKPEPFRKVRALAPFQVVYEGTVYLPDDVATVPASLADAWIRDQWVTDDN